jgi:hypothetical protein
MQQPAQQSSISFGQIRLEIWLYSIALFISMVFYTGIPERHLYQEMFPHSTALKKVTGKLNVTPRKNIDKVAVVTNTGEKISFYCRPWIINYSCIPDASRRTGANIEITIRDTATLNNKSVEAFGVKVNGQQISTYTETKESYDKSKNNSFSWMLETLCVIIAYLLNLRVVLKRKVAKNSLKITFMTYGILYAVLFYIHLCIIK